MGGSLNSRKQEKEGLVSVVADLRQASLQTSRFIAETLLLLEVSSWQSALWEAAVEDGLQQLPMGVHMMDMWFQNKAPLDGHSNGFRKGWHVCEGLLMQA